MRGRVLALNVGSSSFKWALFDGRDELVGDGQGKLDSPSDAVDAVAGRAADVEFVAHRIVHGGERFCAPVVVDDEVRRELEGLVLLAPLHMPPALAVLDAARRRWPRATQIAAFDTAFHATLSREAVTYAVPTAWRERYAMRRYGFHGLSVAYAVSRIEEVAGRAMRRVLVLHLGSGASITAVLEGRSVDTTMGMTPVEGLVMASRSGSVDPGALVRLLRAGVSVDELADGLEIRGGLYALAKSRDMRAIAERAAAGDADARFARAQFVRAAAKHSCSQLVALGGIDAMVFTGGIGEHDAEVRAGVTSLLRFAGISLNPAANTASSTHDRVVSAPTSPVSVLVVHAREDISLLRAARQASCTSP